jgi:YbgC/YbaW family acyl-CoA thioester hydrolase
MLGSLPAEKFAMERIKVSLPESFQFSTVLKIRITDLNYGGHVGNDSFLSLIHEARQQFLYKYGYEELKFAGVGLIMIDSALEYKRELNYGEEVKISVQAEGFDRVGFDFYYLLEVKNEDEWVLAGKAKTGMLCYDYALKKKVAVPAEALEKLHL